MSPPPRLGPGRSSTPGSAGSPGRPLTEAGTCPAPTSGCTTSLESRYDTPSQAPRAIGLGMVAPTILAHATETAKERYLRAPWRGDIVACQLFSEPAAEATSPASRLGRPETATNGSSTARRYGPPGAQYSGHRRDRLPDRPRSAEAQGADGIHRRHAGRRASRCTAAAPDDRRRFLQRGLLHRRPRAGRSPLGDVNGGWIGRAHDAHERARQHRWWRGRGRRDRSRVDAPADRPRRSPRQERGPAHPPADSRCVDQSPGRQVHKRARPCQDPCGRAPGSRALDRKALPHREPPPPRRPRRRHPRRASRGRHGRVGDLCLGGVRARSARHADRRRNRRGDAQHHRRARYSVFRRSPRLASGRPGARSQPRAYSPTSVSSSRSASSSETRRRHDLRCSSHGPFASNAARCSGAA